MCLYLKSGNMKICHILLICTSHDLIYPETTARISRAKNFSGEALLRFISAAE